LLFLSLWSFAKFKLEKNDFDLYKGFFMRKWTQIHQISKKKIQNHHIFTLSSSR
jgi:hypothetical protein